MTAPEETAEKIDSFSHDSEQSDAHHGVKLSPSSRSEKVLLSRIDMRLLPVIMLLYFWSFLDRVNISNALTLGLQKDLKLKGNQVNICLALFYVPYVVFEIPSNYLLRRLRPQVWLSVCMVSYGIVMLCHGFVKGYSGLLAARFFLGLTECGILPGCSYLLSMWYTPSEALRRYSIFFNSTTLAGAFGSLLASGIAKMQGDRGYAGWRWIFILEGVATACFGIFAFFVIPNFIEDAKWLSEDEKRFMRARIDSDGGNAEADSFASTFPEALKKYFADYKSWLAGILYFGSTTAAYSIAYFLPTIVKGFKYSTIETQLHSVPPFAAAWFYSISISFISARLRHRLGFILFSLAIALVGTAILYDIHKNLHAEYAATFLVTMGVFGALPLWIMWYTMNLRGHLERSIGTAWMLGFGNLGGILATFSFQAADAPLYRKGYAVFFFGICLMAGGCILYGLALLVESRRRKGDEREKRVVF